MTPSLHATTVVLNAKESFSLTIPGRKRPSTSRQTGNVNVLITTLLPKLKILRRSSGLTISHTLVSCHVKKSVRLLRAPQLQFL